jgi:hypothetical protein
MAKNRFLAEARRLTLDVTAVSGSGAGGLVMSGDPVAVGQLVGVALIDEVTVAGDPLLGKASVDTGGAWNLSVKGIDGSGDSAVAVGDAIYYVSADTPRLSKKATGVLFGHALAAVVSGATTTIPVRLRDAG